MDEGGESEELENDEDIPIVDIPSAPVIPAPAPAPSPEPMITVEPSASSGRSNHSCVDKASHASPKIPELPEVSAAAAPDLQAKMRAALPPPLKDDQVKPAAVSGSPMETAGLSAASVPKSEEGLPTAAAAVSGSPVKTPGLSAASGLPAAPAPVKTPGLSAASIPKSEEGLPAAPAVSGSPVKTPGLSAASSPKPEEGLPAAASAVSGSPVKALKPKGLPALALKGEDHGCGYEFQLNSSGSEGFEFGGVRLHNCLGKGWEV